MKVDKALISKLEKLARLKLSDDEKEKLSADLEKILGMIEKLKELDTGHIQPLVYLNENPKVLRKDETGNCLQREEALKNAPDSDGTFFRVPKMID